MMQSLVKLKNREERAANRMVLGRHPVYQTSMS